MKAVLGAAVLLLALGGCSAHGVRGPERTTFSPVEEMEQMRGQRIDALIRRFGAPDEINSAAYFSAKLKDGVPSVVLTYESPKRHVYVTRDCVILGVALDKESECDRDQGQSSGKREDQGM